MIKKIAGFVLLSSLAASAPVLAQSRTYAGIFNSRWRTAGVHGHDQPWCAPTKVILLPMPGGTTLYPGADCNRIDFARANLDDSIGFRAGTEKDVMTLGPLALVGGTEAAMSYTEYNLSQVDFGLISVTANGGADLRLGGVRLGARAGLAPFVTTDGAEKGVAAVRAVHLTFPVANGVAFRITRQTFSVIDPHRGAAGTMRRDPRAAETSFLLVSAPGERGPSRWEFSAAAGVTTPGGYVGSSRGLRPSMVSTVSAYRDLPWGGLQGRLSWTAAAHESSIESQFRGYDGNYRSKTINAFGLGAGRVHQLSGRLSRFAVRYGAGLDVADWRDNYQLLTRDGKSRQGGVEMGPNADVALRFRLAPHLAFETSLQKVYWRAIDVGEGRYSFGLVTTR